MSDWDFSWLDRYEGFSGGAQLQLELMQPFNLYDMAVDPSNETVTKAAYMPAIGYSSYWLTTKILGEAMPSFWVRAASRFHDIKMMAQAAGPYAANVAIVTAPVATAVVGAIGYEKVVNEPIRRSHPGSSGTWFGPFASGFGPVV
jgi:hypothetical protein